ncbi:flagellar motor protein MotB [Silvibacterium acidisoli]|uniref:flagellar motor protein MotB n=1 Tax=Acidobacteriaceae bacterium ZG23-2 TaxID=2883246 RepID=UPI00406CAA1A
MAKRKTTILIKKVQPQAVRHSGAWKVAYADFVTALMALFIVLWLMNTSDQVRKLVAGYFNDPMGRASVTGTDRSGSADNLPLTKSNVKQLKQRLEHAIEQMADLKALAKQIEITVTPEGLRIELMETKNGAFFETGSTALNASGRELLGLIAKELGDIPNNISIEGHTDAQPYSDPGGYGNWELSTDRANAARRLMQSTGLRTNQVSQVRGYADQKLRLPEHPLDPSNRRISLIVQYMERLPAPAAAPIAVTVSKPAGEMPGASQASAAKTAAPMVAAEPAKPASPAARIAEQLLARLHRH